MLTYAKDTPANVTHTDHTCKPEYIGDGRNCTGTVNNLKNLQILFDNNNNFLFIVVVFYFCNVGKGSYPQLVLGFES